MSWLGLDVGGANLKLADGRGWARSVPFALWQMPKNLAEVIAEIIRQAPAARGLAVTMTGELADCFCTKAEGVRHILKSVQEVASNCAVLVYLVGGRFVSVEAACDLPQQAAASNWRALAEFACRYVNDRTAVLIDIGSTTSDIIPIANAQPCPQGMTDTERLLAGELVYTGVGRTPICAVTRWLPLDGEQCPIAAELFASTADAYVLMGRLPEDENAAWTADGRPLTRKHCWARMARMFCADTSEINTAQAILAGVRVQDAQREMLREALAQVASRLERPPQRFVLSGAGEFLAREIVEHIADTDGVISLNEELGKTVSASAPAHAVAVLARERAEQL